jgi:transposase
MKGNKTARRLGIDLGKNSFHVWGVDESEQVVFRKKLRRQGLRRQLAKMPPAVVGMEACGGAHYWARELAELGHEVRLMAPQFVKAYVKGNKNDFNDAEAICEAVGRANMRFVTVKSVQQQDMLATHRIRQSVLKARTAQSNQIRGLLAEYGIVIGEGVAQVRRAIPELLEDGENALSALFRELLREMYEHLCALDERFAQYERRIAELFRQQPECRRIAAVEGVGPLTATAIVATFTDARQFDDGRQFSAALGLVPRHQGTGGRVQLQGISKRGDRYIRTLLIHGARSAVNAALAGNKTDARSLWIKDLVARRGKNRAAVALANKNARIIWALLSRQESYRAAA